MNDAEWTFLPLFHASAITSILFPCRIYSNFFILYPLLLLHLVFHCLRHGKRFVHLIIRTWWIHTFSCIMIIMIPVKISFIRILTDSSTSIIQAYFVCPPVARQVSLLLRHSGVLQGIAAGIGISIFFDHSSWFPWILHPPDRWNKYHVTFWHYRALVSR